MIEIGLNKGLVALVDDVDADLSQYTWNAKYSKNIDGYYAARSENHNSTVFMHRVILSRMLGRELLRSEHTDHIYHNTLDNRRSELRLSNSSQKSSEQFVVR